MRKLLLLCFVTVAAHAASQSPTVSPDGTRIAFVSDRDGMTDLYVITADGGRETRLTHDADVEGRASWSSDGKRIFFTLTADNLTRIYAIDADGKNRRQIGSVQGRSVRLSPDGKRAIVARGGWTEMQLLVTDLDGSNERLINDGKSIAWGPQWSPDGREIAYGTRDGAQHMNVSVMKADGSHVRQVTHLPVETGEAQMPAWSGNGRKLAIQVDNAAAKTAGIWIVDLQSGEAKAITDGTYRDEVPSWFPDGKRIAFQSNRSGAMEVWVMNADGTNVKQLTRETMN